MGSSDRFRPSLTYTASGWSSPTSVMHSRLSGAHPPAWASRNATARYTTFSSSRQLNSGAVCDMSPAAIIIIGALWISPNRASPIALRTHSLSASESSPIMSPPVVAWVICSSRSDPVIIAAGSVGATVGAGVLVGSGAAVGAGVFVGAGVGTGVFVGTGVLVGSGAAVGSGISVGAAVGCGTSVGSGAIVGVGSEPQAAAKATTATTNAIAVIHRSFDAKAVIGNLRHLGGRHVPFLRGCVSNNPL